MPEIEVRAARASDTRAMLEITRTVWGGDDYVPHVWERWLHDRDGALLVATHAGQVVGLQHVQIQPDGDAWLEGIRVAETVRGAGVGEALVEHGLAWARDMGCAAARLAVSGDNAASNRLAEKAGFGVAGRYRTVRAEAEPAPQEPSVRLAQPFEEESILQLLDAAGYPYPATYTQGWTAFRLTRDRLRLLLATHAVVLCGQPTNAIAIATTAPDRPSLRLGLAAGSPSGITSIGRWLRAQADRTRIARVRGTLDASGDVLAALRDASFQVGSEDMMLRERRLS